MILHTIHTTAPVLVVLVDPDKDYYRALSPYLPLVDMVFVGGSTGGNVDVCVAHLRQYTTAPIVLFPGNIQQFTASVDAVLFLTPIWNRQWLFISQVWRLFQWGMSLWMVSIAVPLKSCQIAPH